MNPIASPRHPFKAIAAILAMAAAVHGVWVHARPQADAARHAAMVHPWLPGADCPDVDTDDPDEP